MGLHSVSDFYAVLQYCFIRVSDGNVIFQNKKVYCNDIEPLAASDTTESSSNSALSENLAAPVAFDFELIYFLT